MALDELDIWKGMANYYFLLRSTASKLLISFLCLTKVVTNSVQCQNNALNIFAGDYRNDSGCKEFAVHILGPVHG